MTSQLRQPAGVPVGGQFATQAQSRAAVALDPEPALVLVSGVPLAEAAPPAIDDVLAEIYGRYWQAMGVYRRAEDQVAWLRGTDFRGRRRGTDTEIAEAAEQATRAFEAAQRIRDEEVPYEEEFRRRGGWNRAYLVDNPDGHLHKSMNCSTCNNGQSATQFHWVTELSGKTEAEIVDAAGADACTTCYPDAPVTVLARPSRIDSPNRRDRAAAEEERQRRAAEKAAKAILDPATGTPLREITDSRTRGLNPGPEYKTERGAEIAAVEGLANLLWYGDRHPGAAAWRANAESVARAIAAKHGTDPAEVLAALEAKAAAKDKRDRRAAGLPAR